MYRSGEKVLDEILELVAKCPKEFQEKCFELLLSGYVKREVGTVTPPAPAFQAEPSGPNQGQASAAESHLPAAIVPRFKNTAKRLGISTEKLESLFAVNLKNLKKGASGLFKAVDPVKPIELSWNGIKEAEKLLKGLVGSCLVSLSGQSRRTSRAT